MTMEVHKRNLVKQCVHLLAVELASHLLFLLKPKVQEFEKCSSNITKKSLRKPQRKKRLWVKSATNRRYTRNCSEITSEFFSNDPSLTFLCAIGVGQEQFTWLLNKVSPVIQKQDTFMREALPADIKLKIVLGYLVMGGSYQNLSDQFQVPKNSISSFLSHVMNAICSALEEFIKVPDTVEKWRSIEKEFNAKYNFPNCYGSLGGRNIQIMSKKLPTNRNSSIPNAQECNIMMTALVDAEHCFTYVDVATVFLNDKDQIFEETSFCKILERNSFNLPSNAVVVANSVFPLKDNLMTPYDLKMPYSDETELFDEQMLYNRNISGIVKVNDNTFKILSTKFRVFDKTINVGVDKVPILVKTCCSLHNWLKRTNSSYSESILNSDIDDQSDLGSWCEEYSALGALQNIKSFSSSKSITAVEKQNWYISYFNGHCTTTEVSNEKFKVTSIESIKIENGF